MFKISSFLSFLSILLTFQHAQSAIYTAYQNSTVCQSASEILEPRSQLELLTRVRWARRRKMNVKAIGSKHSITDIICTDGVPISMHNINRSISLDPLTGIATVEAGMTLGDLTRWLHSLNPSRAIKHIPTFMGITIGGALATGAHGSSLMHMSSLSEYVVGVRIINGRGRFQNIDDPDELRPFMVHLGLLGIIVEVKLATQLQFKVQKNHTEVADSILDEIVDDEFYGKIPKVIQMARANDIFELWWFPTFAKVVLGIGKYLSRNEEYMEECFSNFIPQTPPWESKLTREAIEIIQKMRAYPAADAMEYFTKESLFREVIGKPKIFEERSNGQFCNPAIGFSHEIMASECTGDQCIWHKDNKVYNEDNSFSLGLANFTGAVENIRDILRKLQGDFAFYGIYIRFSLQSKAIMSKVFDRDSVHFEWISIKRNKTFEEPRLGLSVYQAMAQSLTSNFNGRPHWGKNTPYYHTKKFIHSCYCQEKSIAVFKESMNRYDPDGIFHNKFAKRLLGESEEWDREFDPQRCALTESCIDVNEDEKDPLYNVPLSCHPDKKDECGIEQKCENVQLGPVQGKKLKHEELAVCRDLIPNEFEPIREVYLDVKNYTLFLEEVLKNFSTTDIGITDENDENKRSIFLH